MPNVTISASKNVDGLSGHIHACGATDGCP